MGTQKKIAEEIINKGGDYVLSLKENHPILHSEVDSFFQKNLQTNFKGQEHKYITTQDKGHGRLEKREYFMVSNINFLTQKEEWKGLITKVKKYTERWLTFVKNLKQQCMQ
jgi:predicted transposase YbfD/YdcC